MKYTVILGSLFLMVTFLGNGCQNLGTNAPSPAPSPQGPPPPDVATKHTWTQIGPQGGYVSAVAFHPSQSGVIWASGDDGAGLYNSNDGGATWQIAQTGSLNQATYSLVFDPNNSNKIFAPNHFGRGMLMSTDGGTTWTASQAGLPISGTANQRLYDIAILPSNSNVIFIATDSGLYKSTNGGTSFSLNSTTLAGGNAVRALAFRQDGILFIGKADGAVGYSGDSGSTWTQLLAPNSTPLSAMTFSSSSLYIAYATADIYRLDKNTFAGGLINNSALAGTIRNGNRLTLAVKSGASAASDLVFVGTMGNSSISASQWGLFKSTNGGTNWTQTMNGMAGNYIMSVAIDPNNSNNVVVGSGIGRGICKSSNGGANWSCVRQGIYATASLGLAQDPKTPNRLLASNTACGGFSSNYETTDGGSTWSSFADPVSNDGVFAFDIDPSNANNVIAGTCTQGIYRSTQGTGGSWTSVIATAGQRVDRFVRDKITPSLTYAIVPTGDSSHSLYYSTNSGASFAARSGIVAWNIAVHPSKTQESIVVNGTNAFASTDVFATSHALGLSTQAAAEGGLIAVGFNSNDPSEVLVAGVSGGLYKTLNYSSSGSGITWTKLSSPITNAAIRDIVITYRQDRSVYYIVTSAGDTGVFANSTSGVFRSADGGQTWSTLSSGLFPTSMVWRFVPDVSSPTTSFYAGMWCGGLFKLSDNE